MNYYKRHLGDYAKDTKTLSVFEHGVYTVLLDEYYTQESPISDDDATSLIRPSNTKESASLAKVLAKYFKREGDVWRHFYADRVIAETQEKADKNRKNGPKGGRPKNHDGSKDKPSDNHDGFKTEPKDNLSHKPLANNHKEQDQKIEQRAAQGGTRIPSDFHPDDEALRWAKAERPDIDALAETAAFMDHWSAKPGAQGRKTDWTATWRNWIRKAYANPRASPRTNHSANPMQSKTMQGIAALEAMKHENRTSTAVVSQLNFERPTKAALLGS